MIEAMRIREANNAANFILSAREQSIAAGTSPGRMPRHRRTCDDRRADVYEKSTCYICGKTLESDELACRVCRACRV